VLDSRTRPPSGRPAKRAALLALLALAVVPAAAEAKNVKVDGRVKGTPVASGGSVTVSFQLTRAANNKVRVGTRNVRIKINRRARLPLSGSGAQGASRLRASGLRVGDRVRGVTVMTRKLRRRMRYTARPTLKVKRARVVRSAPRLNQPGGGPGPAAPRSLDVALAELPTRVASLTARAGEFGSITQGIEAKKLALESLGTGLEGVTTAFETLTSAIEAREPAIDPVTIELLVASVEALVARLEALETSSSAVEDGLSSLESALGTISGALEELATMAPLLSSQASLIRTFPGAEAQVMALDAALIRIEERVGAAEAALNSIGGNIDALNAQMAALTGAVNGQAAAAATADAPTIQAGINGLSGSIGSLEAAFGQLASSAGGVAAAAALEADATALEGAVEMLCTTVPTACP
jgi:prefoldin subunit 5